MVLKNTDPTAHAEVTAIREVRIRNYMWPHKSIIYLVTLKFCGLGYLELLLAEQKYPWSVEC